MAGGAPLRSSLVGEVFLVPYASAAITTSLFACRGGKVAVVFCGSRASRPVDQRDCYSLFPSLLSDELANGPGTGTTKCDIRRLSHAFATCRLTTRFRSPNLALKAKFGSCREEQKLFPSGAAAIKETKNGALWLAVALVMLSTPARSQEQKHATSGPAGNTKPCLIVKHKGTVGRRLLWTALIGVPIAPGAKYDHVDAINFPEAKPAYKGKDLQKFQAEGVRVLILEKNYKPEALDSARNACREPDAQPAQSKQDSKPPEQKQVTKPPA